MKKSVLQLEPYESTVPDTYRAVFKTKHGREVFLSIALQEGMCLVQECFYIDRDNGNGQHRAKPKKLKSFCFPITDLISVIGTELDKQFYEVQHVKTAMGTESTDSYIQTWRMKTNRKYKFLIMSGDGEEIGGLPCVLRTRLKNKLHRSVYLEFAWYKEGVGVVKQCRYYDRRYSREGKTVTPPMLHSCFFPYTKAGILNLVNAELYCDFTHILITDELDPEFNKTPLCGSV